MSAHQPPHGEQAKAAGQRGHTPAPLIHLVRCHVAEPHLQPADLRREIVISRGDRLADGARGEQRGAADRRLLVCA